jgi:hypothetical protein
MMYRKSFSTVIRAFVEDRQALLKGGASHRLNPEVRGLLGNYCFGCMEEHLKPPVEFTAAFGRTVPVEVLWAHGMRGIRPSITQAPEGLITPGVLSTWRAFLNVLSLAETAGRIQYKGLTEEDRQSVLHYMWSDHMAAWTREATLERSPFPKTEAMRYAEHISS